MVRPRPGPGPAPSPSPAPGWLVGACALLLAFLILGCSRLATPGEGFDGGGALVTVPPARSPMVLLSYTEWHDCTDTQCPAFEYVWSDFTDTYGTALLKANVFVQKKVANIPRPRSAGRTGSPEITLALVVRPDDTSRFDGPFTAGAMADFVQANVPGFRR